MPDSKKKAAPSYTLGSKLKSSDATTGPGPAQYNVSGMRPKGKDYPRAATLQSRPKELTAFVTPGPGEYNVNEAYKVAKDATPKYSIGKMPPPDKYQLIPGKSRRFHSYWFFWLALFEWLELESHWDSKCWSRIRCTYIYKYGLVVVCMRITNIMDYGEASINQSINQSSHQAIIMEIAGASLYICIYRAIPDSLR